MILKLYKF